MPRRRDFNNELRRAFDVAFAKPASALRARSGCLTLDLQFGDPGLADAFGPSFLQPQSADRADLAISFINGHGEEFRRLLPTPVSDNHLLVTDEHYLFWWPGEQPLLYAVERTGRRAFVWLANGEAPNWELSRPALPILHAYAVDTPWTAVHGGAVGQGDRFLMLAGKGRAGKTTAALACARAGWRYAGDDYVFANGTTGQVEPLYCSARLRIDMASRFKDLLHDGAALSQDDGEQRYELRLAGSIGAISGGTVAAILLPRRRGAARPSFAPARRVDAYAALITVTTMGLPGWPQRTAEKLSALIGVAPVFFVDTGSLPEAIPDAFADFLAKL